MVTRSRASFGATSSRIASSSCSPHAINNPIGISVSAAAPMRTSRSRSIPWNCSTRWRRRPMAGSEQLRVVQATAPNEHPPPEEWRLHPQLLNFARDLNEVHRRERSPALELEAALEQLQDSQLAHVRILGAVVSAGAAATRARAGRPLLCNGVA